MGGPGGAAFASAAHSIAALSSAGAKSPPLHAASAACSQPFCSLPTDVAHLFRMRIFNVSNTEIRQALSWKRAAIGLAQIA